MNLNPEQKVAVASREGAWLCMACPGAGKTRVIVERIKSLLAEGAPPSGIVALTFTREAASELHKRIGGDFTNAYTFHSLGYKIVRAEHRYLPYGLSSDPFPAGNVLYKLLADCMKSFGVGRKFFPEIKAFISKQKRQRIPAENSDVYNKVYGQYEKRLRDGGMLDFDGMIVEAVNLLERNSEVLDRWQFRWVHCDEGQDTDDLQFRFLQLLSQKHGNIMCVGDFCQALYSFRGARPENLINFSTWFPDSRKLILPINYRSTPELLAFFRSIAPIKNELTENMRTENPSLGIPVQYRKYDSDNEEAEKTLEYILSCIQH